MRVLFVAPGLPYPPDTGGRSRVFNLLKGLSERHEVTLLSLLHDDEDAAGVERLRSVCERVVTVRPDDRGKRVGPLWAMARALERPPRTLTPCRSRALGEAMLRLAEDDGFAVLHLDNLGLAHLADRSGAPNVLGKHDVEWLVLWRLSRESGLSPARRVLVWRAVRRLRSYERMVLRDFAAVTVVSEEDRRVVARDGEAPPIAVVPNGVDVDYFVARSPEEAAPGRLLLAGSLFWSPNAQGALWFCAEVWPRIRREWPGVSLEIVGSGAPPAVQRLAALPGVVVRGRVEDIRPHYAGAAVCVVPLRAGGGTRLRILEAMAMERPVVSTTIGAEGLSLRAGEHLLIADAPEEFANRVRELLADRAAARALGQRARQHVAALYQWKTIVPELEALYAAVQTGGK